MPILARPETAQQARDAWVAWRTANRPAPAAGPDDAERSYDAFVSYARSDATDALVHNLLRRKPSATIFLESKVCQEELNVARLRHLESDSDVLFPLYALSAASPTSGS